jgi:hypothetical protein
MARSDYGEGPRPPAEERRAESGGPQMWNDFTTDGAVGIRAEITIYPGGNGDEIHAYVARPLVDTKRGGVIL